MLVSGKPIKRNWIYDHDRNETRQGEAFFIATGQWADGRLAYSLLDEHGQVIDEHDGAFIQVRDGGKLLMVRI